MSATPPPFPPQLELPGQAHTAQGPLPLTSIYVTHHAIRRDLDRFTAAVERTPLSDAEVWRALRRRWERFCSLVHHHQEIEDRLVWAVLADRVDGVGRAVLAEVHSEHTAVEAQLSAVTAAFRQVAGAPEPERRNGLTRAVVVAGGLVGAHLAHEETAAWPLAQQHLTAADWTRVEREFPRIVGLRDMLVLGPWSTAGCTRQQVARLFADTSQAFRPLLWLTRRRFAAREAVAFRYA